MPQVKLLYAQPGDSDILVSETFDSLEQAQKFQQTKAIDNYFVMENVGKNGEHEEWKLYNRGMYGMYKVLFFIRDNWLAIVSFLLVIAFAVYYQRKSNLEAAIPPPVI